MATEPLFSVPLTDFAAALLSERELTPRARIVAQQVSELLPESADQEQPAWRLKAYVGDISLDSAEVPWPQVTGHGYAVSCGASWQR